MSMEDSWVFDSLVCFLHGPVWNAPLQTFIEEKCLAFDPNTPTDESSPEVQQLHDEYKNLVDYMLGSFMEEMQVTPDQFETACAEGRQHLGENPFQFHSGLFQQIWAANDIKIFVRMMAQRNVELQLQALDLIEKNQLALLQEHELLENEPSNSVENSLTSLADVPKSLEACTSPEAALTPENDSTDVADKFERLNLFFSNKNEEVDPVAVQDRQQYLRQQRDKIVEIKRKSRAKQLSETVTRTSPTDRPTSAKMAQKLLENDIKSAEGLFEPSAVNPALQLRRTLAQRLKLEVVEQK